MEAVVESSHVSTQSNCCKVPGYKALSASRTSQSCGCRWPVSFWMHFGSQIQRLDQLGMLCLMTWYRFMSYALMHALPMCCVVKLDLTAQISKQVNWRIRRRWYRWISDGPCRKCRRICRTCKASSGSHDELRDDEACHGADGRHTEQFDC